MNERDELVTVATFESSVEASVARAALEADGIVAFAPTETAVHGLNQAGSQLMWAEIQVRAADRARALDVLRRAGHR